MSGHESQKRNLSTWYELWWLHWGCKCYQLEKNFMFVLRHYETVSWMYRDLWKRIRERTVVLRSVWGSAEHKNTDTLTQSVVVCVAKWQLYSCNIGCLEQVIKLTEKTHQTPLGTPLKHCMGEKTKKKIFFTHFNLFSLYIPLYLLHWFACLEKPFWCVKICALSICVSIQQQKRDEQVLNWRSIY